MDVLTIILIFLLVNYSEVVEEVEMPDYITLPKVKITSIGKSIEGITLIVGKDRWALGPNQVFAFNSFSSQRDDIMEKVAQGLDKMKKSNEIENKKTNLVILADKEIPYKMIDSAILTAAGVGITAIDLVALRNQN